MKISEGKYSNVPFSISHLLMSLLCPPYLGHMVLQSILSEVPPRSNYCVQAQGYVQLFKIRSNPKSFNQIWKT